MSEHIYKELKRAINTEAEGFSFYNYASELVGDPKGKAVFKQLAKDELDHIRALTTLSESIMEGGRWVSYKEALERVKDIGTQKAPIFPSIEKVKGWLRDDPTDIDALKFGIDIEEKAVAYYSDLLAKSTDQSERDFFSSLVDIEKGHLSLLQWEYDSLTQSGFWCDHQEYTVEGER